MADHAVGTATMSPALVKVVDTVAEAPWYAAFPEPSGKIKSIEQRALLQLLKNENVERKFVLVDLRRDDHKASETYLATIISI